MGEVTKGEPLQGLSLEIKKNAMGSHICTYTQTHTHTHLSNVRSVLERLEGGAGLDLV